MTISFQPHHFGLFLGQADLDEAQTKRGDEILARAWAWLDAPAGAQLGTRPAPTPEDPEAQAPILKPALTGIAEVQAHALRYKLSDDAETAKHTLMLLYSEPFSLSRPFLECAMDMVARLACAEMLRSADANAPRHADRVLHELLQALPHTPLEQIWLDVLKMAASITQEHAEHFSESVQAYKGHIATIHPEGYLRTLVTGGDAETLKRQLLGTLGLTLMAEMAHQVGKDLWGYEVRGISIATAASYCVYYYFFPEQWKWHAGLEVAQVQALYQEYGAFLEIAQRRTKLLGKATEKLLEDQRPYYSILGGLTTLTHGVILAPFNPPKKKRRWFW